MKVAVVLYGYFRTFEFCKKSLNQYVLDPLNADVFISSPDTIYARTTNEVPELHHVYARSVTPTDQVIRESFSLTRLKKYKTRTADATFYQDYATNHNIAPNNGIGQYSWRILATLHSISLSVQLFRNYLFQTQEKYDLVILTRPDLRYYRHFDTSVLQMDKINYPACHMCEPGNPSLAHLPPEERKEVGTRIRHGGAGVFGFPGQWFNDQIICGSQENILTFANMFSSVTKYYNEQVYLNSETYLGVHCMRNKLGFVGTDFTTYEMWRLDQPEY